MEGTREDEMTTSIRKTSKAIYLHVQLDESGRIITMKRAKLSLKTLKKRAEKNEKETKNIQTNKTIHKITST